jgi:hypothetical protein
MKSLLNNFIKKNFNPNLYTATILKTNSINNILKNYFSLSNNNNNSSKSTGNTIVRDNQKNTDDITNQSGWRDQSKVTSPQGSTNMINTGSFNAPDSENTMSSYVNQTARHDPSTTTTGSDTQTQATKSTKEGFEALNQGRASDYSNADTDLNTKNPEINKADILGMGSRQGGGSRISGNNKAGKHA